MKEIIRSIEIAAIMACGIVSIMVGYEGAVQADFSEEMHFLCGYILCVGICILIFSITMFVCSVIEDSQEAKEAGK